MRKYLDAIILGLSVYVLVRLYDPSSWNQLYLLGVLFAVITFFIIGELRGLYRSWLGVALRQEMVCVANVWLSTMLVLLLIAYAFKVTEDFSRVVMGLWFVLTPLLLWLWRYGWRRLRRGGHTHHAAIAGGDDTGLRMAEVLQGSKELGYELSGFFDDRDANRLAMVSEKQGDFNDLVDRARQGELDTIYITLPIMAKDRIRDLIDDLSDTTAEVYVVPDFFISTLFQGGRWSTVNDMPVVSIYETPFSGVDGVLKRLQDVALSLILLSILALPMAIIGLWIKIESTGPAIFRQRRYGLDGREIRVWKFRTMTVCEDGDQVPQATREDSRCTPFGAFLRKTSLDELPQFFNVLMGEMSIVGPRPHAVAHNEHYRRLVKGYMLRHKVKPGITGWAQVNGWRGETAELEKMAKRVEHDLWYIRNWNFMLDLKICFMTAMILFKDYRSQRVY